MRKNCGQSFASAFFVRNVLVRVGYFDKTIKESLFFPIVVPVPISGNVFTCLMMPVFLESSLPVASKIIIR
jgi:hypothetical protein